ncbi:MAG: DUF1501 domain-containing protein [Planctomycetales bacterium]|nr:DUF1501 domain-containing protein [Planctomycetales bacterium]
MNRSRRQFLQDSSAIALAPVLPNCLATLAQAALANRQERILVVIQLDGGNDGINTIVPYANDGYAKHRQELRLRREQVLRLSDEVGLHPRLNSMSELLDADRLAIVQGVGYPEPNRSHDVSMSIWQTARFDPAEHASYGWLGRALDSVHDAIPSPGADSILFGNENPPAALRGRKSSTVALGHLRELRLKGGGMIQLDSALSDGNADEITTFATRALADALQTASMLDNVVADVESRNAEYPTSQLASRLRSISQLIKSGFPTPVYYTIQSGYDTHASQLPNHSRLLDELGMALKAFQDDLDSAGLSDKVLTFCFSEFGRAVSENASLGTDHGSVGPVFLMGARVKSGLHGNAPDLTELQDGELKLQFDFRQIYASILEDWFSIPSQTILAGSFSKPNIL